jgi:hypothetical protein
VAKTLLNLGISSSEGDILEVYSLMIESEVIRVSDMKDYTGSFSYTGKYNLQKDGSRLLVVNEFEYDGKYYHPGEPLRLVFEKRIEEDGGSWVSVTCEAISGKNGGMTVEEALGNVLMDAALLYEELLGLEGPMTERLKAIQDSIRSWEVNAIDSKAQ